MVGLFCSTCGISSLPPVVDKTQFLLFHTCLSNLLQETRNFHLPVKMESLSPILQRLTIGRHRTSSACHWPVQDLLFLLSLIGGESQTVGRLSTPEVLTPAPIHRVHGQKSQIRVLLNFSHHPLKILIKIKRIKCIESYYI